MINSKSAISFLIGISLLIFGLTAKVNLLMLSLYFIQAAIVGVAEYRNWGALTVIPLFVIFYLLLKPRDLAEFLYFLGSLAIVWSFVNYLQNKE